MQKAGRRRYDPQIAPITQIVGLRAGQSCPQANQDGPGITKGKKRSGAEPQIAQMTQIEALGHENPQITPITQIGFRIRQGTCGIWIF